MSQIVSETVITNYSNGASTISVNGHITFVKYSTGDKVWFSYENNSFKVIRIETYDGNIHIGD